MGYSGPGAVTQSGGSHSTSSTLSLGYSGTSSAGVYSLNGGVLSARAVVGGTGSAVFNFNGGTLCAASSASSNFLGGLTSAYILTNGAIVDTNGQSIMISQPLLDGGGGGLTKIGQIGRMIGQIGRSVRSGVLQALPPKSESFFDLSPAHAVFGPTTAR